MTLIAERQRYTCLGDDADARVEADLDRIRADLRERWPDLVATVLVGGFGRGEGGVLVADDGTCRPINDYDLVVVTRRKIAPEAIHEARQQLAARLGIDWVDIVQYVDRALPRLRPTLFNYDFAKASTVIDGDSSVMDLLPDFAASDIRLEEAEVLLFTRLWCFLGHYRLAYERKKPTGLDAFRLYQQLTKAILAYQDAMLIVRGRYTPQYADRPAVFKEQFPGRRDVFRLIDKATEAKLRPKLSRGPMAMGLYPAVRDLFLGAFYEVGSLIYQAEINACVDYADRYMQCARSRCRRWRGAINRNRYWVRTQHVNVAQLLLLGTHSSAVAEATDYSALRRVRHALGVFQSPSELPDDWDGLREAAAELRMDV